MSLLIPNTVRVNRGKMSIREVAEKALTVGEGKALIIDRGQNGCAKIRFIRVEKEAATILILHIKGFKLMREFRTKISKELYRAACIEDKKFQDQDEERLKRFLSDFLDLPLMSQIAMKKDHTYISLSSQSEHLLKLSFYSYPGNIEIGPRLTILRVEWKT